MMKKQNVLLHLVFVFAAASPSLWAHAEGMGDADHAKHFAAHEECAKSAGIQKGTPPTPAQHEAMRKCLESKGVKMPKHDPAREAAFSDCIKTANIKDGEKPKAEQFHAVHECMVTKGYTPAGHGGHDHPMSQSTPAPTGH
jgi:hypothetical protein